MHMLAAGCLWAWYLVGVDPMPHRAGTRVRLALLIAAAGGHDILAKVMYAHTLPRGGTPEQIRAGAQIVFYGGDIAEVLLAVVLLAGLVRPHRPRTDPRRSATSTCDRSRCGRQGQYHLTNCPALRSDSSCRCGNSVHKAFP